MALNIKSAEAHDLARRLAEARGSTLTDAVTSALKEVLESTQRGDAGVETLLAEVRQVQALVSALPDRDPRSAEEILGYDEQGLPT